MSIINAIFQAIIQGLTEFLPVSSSGHLGLIQHFTGTNGEESVFLSVMLHLGTLIAVFIAFYKLIFALIFEFFRMIGDIFTGKFKWKKMNAERRMIFMLVFATLPLIIIYIFKDIFVSVASDNDIVVEGVCFLFTSVLLFLSDRCIKGTKTGAEMTTGDAFTIGIFQSVAILPGVSRSGSTIASGLLCGLSKETAVQFSFLLGIPPILAGAVLDAKDVAANNVQMEWVPVILGMLVAAVVGFFAIKLLRWILKTDKFQIFAIYTLILGLFTICAGIYEYATGTYLFR